MTTEEEGSFDTCSFPIGENASTVICNLLSFVFIKVDF